MTMGIALLRRQGTNYPADVNTEGDSWGYSNVYRDAMMVCCLADINIDRHCNKVGLRCSDLVAIPTLVCGRILPRSTEDQKGVTSIEIPSSTKGHKSNDRMILKLCSFSFHIGSACNTCLAPTMRTIQNRIDMVKATRCKTMPHLQPVCTDCDLVKEELTVNSVSL